MRKEGPLIKGMFSTRLVSGQLELNPARLCCDPVKNRVSEFPSEDWGTRLFVNKLPRVSGGRWRAAPREGRHPWHFSSMLPSSWAGTRSRECPWARRARGWQWAVCCRGVLGAGKWV